MIRRAYLYYVQPITFFVHKSEVKPVLYAD